MTFRIEYNVTTKEQKIIKWTPEEWAVFEEQTRLENIENAKPKPPTLEERIKALEIKLGII